MNRSLIKLDQAIVDITDIGDYFAAEAGMDVAMRFVENVEISCAFVVRFAYAGHPFPARSRRLRDLRSLPVGGFANYRLYYRISGASIEVVRVLHGARDVARVLLGSSEM